MKCAGTGEMAEVTVRKGRPYRICPFQSKAEDNTTMSPNFAELLGQMGQKMAARFKTLRDIK